MKPNGAQGTYQSVPQNLQSEETGEAKKEPNTECVIESEQNALQEKTSCAPKELQEDEKKPMSPLRKFCFVLSLLQCVLFIVAFGWLIPCKIPRRTDKHHYIQNWELNFYGEDFITNIAVNGFNHKPVALLFGFKSLSNESLFGIRAVNAFDGSSMWSVNTIFKPENIVCSTFDVDTDNTPDCLVTSNVGDMFALSVKDGKIIWQMLEDEGTLDINLISKPVMGAACHETNVQYIYATVEDKLGRYHFVTISSPSGRIEKIYELPECAALPENMMWKASKVEHEELDHPRELVMSCENQVGNGIIYTFNADEFCKNGTSPPFNEIFKLGIVDRAKSPLRAELLKTSQGDNLAVLTHDGRIKVLSKEKDEEAQFAADKTVSLKDFVVGHFTNNSLVNIVVLASSSTAKSYNLLLLDNTSSQSLRSIPVGNGTATSLYTVHNAFNSFDTVLLKLVTETSDDESLEVNSTNPSSDLKYFEVKYVILECFEKGTFRIVTEDLISASCHEENCKPDVFQERTATLADVDNDGTEELIYFTRKMLPSTLVQSVTLRFKRLVEPLAKSCNACHCYN